MKVRPEPLENLHLLQTALWKNFACITHSPKILFSKVWKEGCIKINRQQVFKVLGVLCWERIHGEIAGCQKIQSNGHQRETTISKQCYGLEATFCGFILHLIGRKTINIPGIFSGVYSFMGKNVRLWLSGTCSLRLNGPPTSKIQKKCIYSFFYSEIYWNGTTETQYL